MKTVDSILGDLAYAERLEMADKNVKFAKSELLELLLDRLPRKYKDEVNVATKVVTPITPHQSVWNQAIDQCRQALKECLK